jgi:ATP-dependent Zn protease
MEDIRKATAYHEAGHVVMGNVTGRNAVSVTIVRRRDVAGETVFEKPLKIYPSRFDHSPEKKQYLRVLVLTKLAGTAAHDLLCPNRDRDEGDAQDEWDARDTITAMMSWDEEDHDGYLDKLKIEARDILRVHWRSVAAIAEALLKDDKLDEKNIISIIEGSTRPK